MSLAGGDAAAAAALAANRDGFVRLEHEESLIPMEDLGDPRRTNYTDAEQRGIRRCLDVVDQMAEKRRRDGLTNVTFSLGVLNTVLIAYVHGAFPQHFWVLYLVEGCVLFPQRFAKMEGQRPKQTCSWLEFCWIMNFAGFFLFFLLALDKNSATDMNLIGDFLSHKTREDIFVAVWGVSCGALLVASIGLRNALVFHDVSNLGSVFIHFLPPLVCYTLRWRHDRVHEAWPLMFELDYFQDVTSQKIITGGLFLYTAWLVPYSIWMYCFGLALPKKGVYDTTFHETMRGGPDKVVNAIARTFCPQRAKRSPDEMQRRREQNDYEFVDDFVPFMAVHFVATNLFGLAFAVLSFQSERMHAAILLLALVSVVFHGSNRYTFYILKSYSLAIKKEAGL